MTRTTRLLVPLGVLFATPPTAAQCVVEGATLADLRGASEASRFVSQPLRVTLAGTQATLEGVSPLVFRREVPAAQVWLYLGEPLAWQGLLAASPGLRVRVTGTRDDRVVATLDASAMTVRAVEVPCRALRTQPVAVLRAEAPARAPEPRWISQSMLRYATQCRQGEGSLSCAERLVPGSRCRLRHDGSQCGYHPVGGALRVFDAPSVESLFITLTTTRDVVWVDDDGRPGWIRLQSRGPGASGLAVRGWARARDLRWAQEVPPSLRHPEQILGHPGRAVRVGTRRGTVLIPADTDVRDGEGAVFARVGTAPFCTRAEQPQGGAHALIALPGMGEVDDDARVDAARLTWVDACPDGR